MTQTSKTSSIPSQAEYETREIGEARHKEVELSKESLADRKESKATFFTTMSTKPELVAERIGWMFDGNYGKGVQLIALQILGASRSNRAAQITQLVGVHEWSVPSRMTADAWHMLSAKQKAALDKAVMGALDAAARELAEQNAVQSIEQGTKVAVETIVVGDTVRIHVTGKGGVVSEQNKKVEATERSGGYFSLIFKSSRKVCLMGDLITKI